MSFSTRRDLMTLTVFTILVICLSNHLGICSPASIRHNTQLSSKSSVNKKHVSSSIKAKAIGGPGTDENYLPTENPGESIIGKSVIMTTKEKNGNSTRGSSHFSIEDILRQLVTASHAVEHLEKMKNRLLSQFQNKTGDFATARGGYGGYGAYGFPSLEGALLSLAFLTFAVFLIDLIQQLLSRFRTGSTGIVPLVGRRKRSFVPEDEYDPITSLTSSVLKAVETPFFKM